MIETLVVTNSDNITELLTTRNYQGNVLVAQQVEKTEFNVKKINNLTIVQSETKGIGVNRDLALMFASGEICVKADDDMFLKDNYVEKVKQAYQELPDADVILFDLKGYNNVDMKNHAPTRVRWYNYMRFGAGRFSFKREAVLKKGIRFNHYFGASVFGSGEDTLFLKDCLKHNLKIYYYPISIAVLEEVRESTWFEGYNKKYYFDKGALFYAISPFFYRILLLRHVLKTRDKRDKQFKILEAYKVGLEGVKHYQRIGQNYGT